MLDWLIVQIGQPTETECENIEDMLILKPIFERDLKFIELYNKINNEQK